MKTAHFCFCLCLFHCPMFCVFFVVFVILVVLITLSGKLLFCAMVFIVFHSVFCLSVVSGRDCILVM